MKEEERSNTRSKTPKKVVRRVKVNKRKKKVNKVIVMKPKNPNIRRLLE